MIRFMIRDFENTDYEQLLNVWEELDSWFNDKPDDLEQIQYCLKIGGKLLVAEDITVKKIIGTAWLTFDGRIYYLHHFGVLKKYRKKGIARQLLEALITFAKKSNKLITLEVEKENIEAIEFYKKFESKFYTEYFPLILL